MCSLLVLPLKIGVLLRECPSPSRQPGCIHCIVGSALRLSRQRGGAWAHDCAVWDEEVAEDQDESGGHCGWCWGWCCGCRKFPKRDA
jgi:hypothetical protein